MDLQQITDRLDIERLVNQYLRSLDNKSYENDDRWAHRYFTEDAWSGTPVGVYEGADAQLSSTRRGMAPFEGTVHFGSNVMVELDGDRAEVRWNQLSTHRLREGEGDRLFFSGGHVEAEVVRTGEGWRMRRMRLAIAWTQGTPPIGAVS
ncbi:nuclear transport factor 2 family protein [Streptomyces orinoci]|uniref:Nuclear transport factor 2 family protein n=1 Tax=Streptomyces orinoci TaxID=67339 RepID=A0ABV3K7C0_STRON|nr:nuclear transport factor 2 family protein [Streptomyces orinoci]